MRNAECRMKSYGSVRLLAFSSFCILHFAFCISSSFCRCSQSKRQITAEHFVQRMPCVHEDVMRAIPLAAFANSVAKRLHFAEVAFSDLIGPGHHLAEVFQAFE